MLELRLSADAKRVASMRDAVHRECERLHAGSEHAEAITLVLERLVGTEPGTGRRRVRGRRSGDVFVIVTVQSDATMLMVRDPLPESDELGEARQRLLREHTSGWSTMKGREGRTVWAEIACDVGSGRSVATRPQMTSTPSPRAISPPVVISA